MYPARLRTAANFKMDADKKDLGRAVFFLSPRIPCVPFLTTVDGFKLTPLSRDFKNPLVSNSVKVNEG